MSSLVLMDAMLSVDLDEEIRVEVKSNEDDPEDESIYITFYVGKEDEENEICFAIDRANAVQWDRLLRKAADGALNVAFRLLGQFGENSNIPTGQPYPPPPNDEEGL